MRYITISMMILTGCGTNISQPPNSLTGTWGGRLVELKVTSNQSILRLNCLTARLSTITLDAEGHFDVMGTVIEASWGGAIGRDFRLEGSVSGTTMTTAGQTLYEGGWTEPVPKSLVRDTEGDFSPPRSACIV